MAVNKVEIDGVVKLDLTQDTVTEDTLLKGVTAHDAAGNAVEGKVVTTPVPVTSNLLKGDGVGGMSAAVPGTDYLAESDVVYCYITHADSGTGFVSSMNPAQIYEATKSGKLVYAVDEVRMCPAVFVSRERAHFMVVLAGGVMYGYIVSETTIRQLTYTLQDKADMVTSVSVESTDEQYPSAKAVWNALIARVPSVTASDNGKFLRVVAGAWAAVEVSNANGVSF